MRGGLGGEVLRLMWVSSGLTDRVTIAYNRGRIISLHKGWFSRANLPRVEVEGCLQCTTIMSNL